MVRCTRTFVALLVLVAAGCSGGGGTSAPVPTATPTNAPASRPVTFTISFNVTQLRARARLKAQARLKSHSRRPLYISPNTGSIGVGVNGGASTYSAVTCTPSGVCQASVTVSAPVNQVDTFAVTAWTGPDGPTGGVLLSDGSASTYVTAGGTVVVPVTLGGVVAKIISVNLDNTAFTSGTDATAQLTVTAEDPSGAIIIGCYDSPVPVQIFENDNLGAFSLSNHGTLTQGSVEGSGSTADGCSPDVGQLTLYYRGEFTGPSFPADAVIAADLPGTLGTTFGFEWGEVNAYGLFYNAPKDASTVADEVASTCPTGTVGCAYYQPALAPFEQTVTALGAAATGEIGGPAVWSTDNYTGLVAGITSAGVYSLFPTDGQMTGPPHSADPEFPNYSVPVDLGGGSILISDYQAQNLVNFTDGSRGGVFSALRPAYTSAGFSFPVGAAPSIFVADGSGNLWFADPNTAAVDQSDSSGNNVVSCVVPFTDGSTPVSSNAMAAAGSTVWASTVAYPASGPQAFFIARFPTNIVQSNPCAVPFSDEIPVAGEVDRLALDPKGNLWYADNAGNLGYVPAGGGTPVTQTLGRIFSSNMILLGSYFYALDSADDQLVRVDFSSAPPNAVVNSAALPANWSDISNDAETFNEVWLTADSTGTLWFAGNVASGLRAPTNQVFAIDPSQLGFGTGSPRDVKHRHAAKRPRRDAHRMRGTGRRWPLRRSLPNFGFAS